MPRGRKPAGIAVLVIWIVIWTAGIFVSVYLAVAEALDGDFVPALFLAVWIAVALFALLQAIRTLIRQLEGSAGPRHRRSRQHRWNDGLPPKDRTPNT